MHADDDNTPFESPYLMIRSLKRSVRQAQDSPHDRINQLNGRKVGPAGAIGAPPLK